MKKRKKLLLIVAVVLVALLAGAYKFALAPKPKPVKMKIEGTIVSAGDPFTLNLAGGHYGRVTVALLLSKAPPMSTTDPSGAGTAIPQQAAVRAIITNDLTGISPSRLIDKGPRERLVHELLVDLKKSTDEPVTQVYFTDLAVQ